MNMQHTRDMQLVSQALHQMAEQTGWGQEIDQLIFGLNEHLSVPIDPRKQIYHAVYAVRVEFTSTPDAKDDRAAILQSRIKYAIESTLTDRLVNMTLYDLDLPDNI